MSMRKSNVKTPQPVQTNRPTRSKSQNPSQKRTEAKKAGKADNKNDQTQAEVEVEVPAETPPASEEVKTPRTVSAYSKITVINHVQ